MKFFLILIMLFVISGSLFSKSLGYATEYTVGAYGGSDVTFTTTSGAFFKYTSVLDSWEFTNASGDSVTLISSAPAEVTGDQIRHGTLILDTLEVQFAYISAMDSTTIPTLTANKVIVGTAEVDIGIFADVVTTRLITTIIDSPDPSFTFNEETTDTGFTGRYTGGMATTASHMYILGGYGDGVGYMNDVWKSNNGGTWIEVTSDAVWEARRSHMACTKDGYMYVFGGIGGSGYLNDVWRSTDGLNWTEMTSSAGWSGRQQAKTCVYDDKIWVSGGFDGVNLNDVWYSDSGEVWTQATASANWSVRRSHTMFVHDSKMWVVSGFSGGAQVWYSTNGVLWTQATSTAPFGTRQKHMSGSDGTYMYVFAGEVAGLARNDLWRSSDGINWSEIVLETEPTARVDATAVLFDGRWFVACGYNNPVFFKDVWSWNGGSTSPINLNTKTHLNDLATAYQGLRVHNGLFLFPYKTSDVVSDSVYGQLYYNPSDSGFYGMNTAGVSVRLDSTASGSGTIGISEDGVSIGQTDQINFNGFEVVQNGDVIDITPNTTGGSSYNIPSGSSSEVYLTIPSGEVQIYYDTYASPEVELRAIAKPFTGSIVYWVKVLTEDLLGLIFNFNASTEADYTISGSKLTNWNSDSSSIFNNATKVDNGSASEVTIQTEGTSTLSLGGSTPISFVVTYGDDNQSERDTTEVTLIDATQDSDTDFLTFTETGSEATITVNSWDVDAPAGVVNKITKSFTVDKHETIELKYTVTYDEITGTNTWLWIGGSASWVPTYYFGLEMENATLYYQYTGSSSINILSGIGLNDVYHIRVLAVPISGNNYELSIWANQTGVWTGSANVSVASCTMPSTGTWYLGMTTSSATQESAEISNLTIKHIEAPGVPCKYALVDSSNNVYACLDTAEIIDCTQNSSTDFLETSLWTEVDAESRTSLTASSMVATYTAVDNYAGVYSTEITKKPTIIILKYTTGSTTSEEYSRIGLAGSDMVTPHTGVAFASSGLFQYYKNWTSNEGTETFTVSTNYWVKMETYNYDATTYDMKIWLSTTEKGIDDNWGTETYSLTDSTHSNKHSIQLMGYAGKRCAVYDFSVYQKESSLTGDWQRIDNLYNYSSPTYNYFNTEAQVNAGITSWDKTTIGPFIYMPDDQLNVIEKITITKQ